MFIKASTSSEQIPLQYIVFYHDNLLNVRCFVKLKNNNNKQVIF